MHIVKFNSNYYYIKIMRFIFKIFKKKLHKSNYMMDAAISLSFEIISILVAKLVNMRIDLYTISLRKIL